MIFHNWTQVRIWKYSSQNQVTREILTKLRLIKSLQETKDLHIDQDFNLKVDLNENLGNYWKCISGID